MNAFELVLFSIPTHIANYTFGFCAMDSLPTSAVPCLQYSFPTAAVTIASTLLILSDTVG
jgi:hypothetical protein